MKRIYPALFLMLVAACTFSTEPENGNTNQEVSFGQQFTFGIGDTASVIGTDMELRLVGIKDGRCPEGLYCFWQGEAIVALEINGLAQTRTDFQLSTHDPTLVDTLDYRFTLMKVEPLALDWETPVAKEDYGVTLTIEALPLVP